MPHKRLLSPIRLWLRKEGDFCPNLGHDSLMRDPAFLRVLPRSRTGGSMLATSYEVQIKVGRWYRKLSFCWRPDVTFYYLGFARDSWLRRRSYPPFRKRSSPS